MHSGNAGCRSQAASYFVSGLVNHLAANESGALPLVTQARGRCERRIETDSEATHCGSKRVAAAATRRRALADRS